MLVPADTSTRWWAESVAYVASEVRFILGRVWFWKSDGSGPNVNGAGGGGMTIPSALVIYSPAGGPPRHSYVPRGEWRRHLTPPL